MKKENIKSGMVVKLRKGCWCLVLDYKDDIIFINNSGAEIHLRSLSEDLTHGLWSEYDVIAVGETEYPNILLLRESKITVIWKRNRKRVGL